MRWSRRHPVGGTRVAGASTDSTGNPICQRIASVPLTETLTAAQPDLGVDDDPTAAPAHLAQRTPDKGHLASRYLPGNYLG